MTQCRDFLLACLRDNPLLAGAVVAFNTRVPAPPASEGVLSGGVRPEAAPLLPLFARDARSSSRMAGRLPLLYADAGTAGLKPRSWWALDFRVARHRLALLDPDTLTRLVLWCGLMRHRGEIARTIDRESVLALRAEVGEEGHMFVLRRSALLPGARDLRAAPEGGGPIGERLRAGGCAMIASCLADAPGTVTAAFLRTAPGMFAEPLRSAPAAGGDPSRHWPLVRTLLFKEIAPAWEPCFT